MMMLGKGAEFKGNVCLMVGKRSIKNLAQFFPEGSSPKRAQGFKSQLDATEDNLHHHLFFLLPNPFFTLSPHVSFFYP